MLPQVDELALPHALMTIEARPAVWLSGPTCIRHEVFGEVSHPEQMRRILTTVQGRTDASLPAWIMPEPHQDPHALMVWIPGGKVGNLPRELAASWQPILGRLHSRYGAFSACQATLDPPSAANGGGFGVVLWLPALPGNASPTAPAPASARVAPVPAPPPQSTRVMGTAPPPEPSELERVRAELTATRVELDGVAGGLRQARERLAVVTEESAVARATLGRSEKDLEAARDELRSVQAALLEARRDPEELVRIRAQVALVRNELETAGRELRSVEEAREIQSFGFYAPRYGFESSAQYSARLKGIREEQQMLIKEGRAAPCDTTWTVGGSAAEGKKMVKQQAKLMLRAFNGECDSGIAKVRYDNVVTLEQRLTKAYDDINKLGEVQRIFISRRYFDLRLAELHLVHEHREKLQQEKEEQKRIKEQMREEQKAQEEIERAKAEAEMVEARSAAALEKARAELAAADLAAAAALAEEEARARSAGIEAAHAASAEKLRAATAAQHDKLESLVNRLETDLKDALDRKAKAIARAQLTRSGHVYVLSNVGSFGEGVFKIGMTRRLDPLERVDELGDASVPFPFDVHAIIYSEDAPSLESKLHQAFATRRVNAVNNRKEYFRVSLDEVRAEVQRLHGLVTFLLDAEAEEFRKTLAALGAQVPSVPEASEPP